MKKAKVVLIVQARMGSTRLPGKVLMDVAGKPMLSQQLRRLKRCTAVDEIVIATTTNPVDEPLYQLANREQVGCFRGSEQDVLSRFVGAARQTRADVIVRITADCPLIDPQVTDRIIIELTNHAGQCDYASNVLQRTYPRGLDVEAIYWDTLLRIDRLAQSQASREHVTTIIRFEQPQIFLCRSVMDTENNADLRWTVDTAADLQLIRILYDALDLDRNIAPYSKMLAYVRAHPELSQINAGIGDTEITTKPT